MIDKSWVSGLGNRRPVSDVLKIDGFTLQKLMLMPYSVRHCSQRLDK